MAYDEQLATRIRRHLEGAAGVTEKKMFGGLSFLMNGNMLVGIVKDTLVVRVGPEHHDEALAAPHTRAMDFAGKPMKGMVYVEPPGFGADEALGGWIQRALGFVKALPAKVKKPRKRRGA